MIDIETANQLKSIIDINTVKVEDTKETSSLLLAYNNLTDLVFLLDQMKELGIISPMNSNKNIAKLILFRGKRVNLSHYNSIVHKVKNPLENYNNHYTIIEVDKLNKLESRLKELDKT